MTHMHYVTPLDVLETARRLLGRGAHAWTQRTPARAAAGNPVSFHVPAACSWSLPAAVKRAAFSRGANEAVMCRALATVQDVLAGMGVWTMLDTYNDARDRTYEDILRVLDQAILIAKARGAE